MKTQTHHREHVNRTHLAALNITTMQQNGHSLIFKILNSYHSFKENVNGKVDKVKGTYVLVLEDCKLPLVLNATNRDTMVRLAKANGIDSEKAEYIENWIGLKIQLFVDNNVKSRYGNQGIRISPLLVKERTKPEFTISNFDKALAQNASLETILEYYVVSEETKELYINALAGMQNEEE